MRDQLGISVQPLCTSESICEHKSTRCSDAHDLRVKLIPGRQLNPTHVAIWRELQQSNCDLSNPCFAPEFVQAAASVRDDIQVAILEDAQQPVAFFPFQRKRGDRAGPVGGLISDYQGLICRRDFDCDPRDLLKSCGLVAWDFDRLLASQKPFLPYHSLCEPSARIDLSAGYEAYASERREAGTHQIQRCEYAGRRMQRDLGPLHFVRHSAEPRHLAQVLAWKSQQYVRSGWKDLFATEWGRGLVERIHATQNPEFAGVLSLLWAGDQLVAGHMGMRSSSVWHYWFPSYNRCFARYSPGLILLLKMAQSCEGLGLRAIDIGTGISLYKRRLMNSTISVAEGSVERSCYRALFRYARRAMSPLAKWAVFRRSTGRSGWQG